MYFYAKKHQISIRCSSLIKVFVQISFFSSAFVFSLNFSITDSLLVSVFFAVVVLLTSKSCQLETFSKNVLAIFFRMFLGVSIIAVSWVLFVSTRHLFIKICFTFVFLIAVWLIRNLRPLPLLQEEKKQSINQLHDVLICFLLVYLVLIFRGWIHLWPAALLLFILARTLNSPNQNPSGTIKVLTSRWFSAVAVVIASSIAHISVTPYSSRFWISYDQIFRSAMATGLTRFGWKDSNFGSGYSFRYHWLSEAVGGVLSRVSGIGEHDVIGRLLPAIGILFAFTVVLPILAAFQLNRRTVYIVSALFLLLESSFELFSVGTLWGTAIYLSTVSFVSSKGLENSWPVRIVSYSLLPFISLLSQSALGLSLVLGLAMYLVIGFISRQIRFLEFLINLLALTVTVQLMRTTFFSNASNLNTTGESYFARILSFPGLPIPLGTSSNDPVSAVRLNSLFFMLFMLAMFGVLFTLHLSREYTTAFRLMLSTQFCSSLVLLNFFPIGSYSGKFFALTSLLGLFAGLLVFSKCLESLPRLQFKIFLLFVVFIISVAELGYRHVLDLRNPTHSLIVIVVCLLVFFSSITSIIVSRWRFDGSRHAINGLGIYVVLLVCVSTLVWPHRYFPDQSWSILSRPSYDASILLGRGNIDNCLAFIRTRTAKDTIIATGLWRLPTAPDERFVITSLRSQRRTLVDGPVFDHIGWPSRSYFEELKNVHTEFSNTLSKSARSRLTLLGADYFLLDTRFENSDRTWSSLSGQDVIYHNQDCSIIKLSD
jgi:hypothetical protein